MWPLSQGALPVSSRQPLFPSVIHLVSRNMQQHVLSVVWRRLSSHTVYRYERTVCGSDEPPLFRKHKSGQELKKLDSGEGPLTPNSCHRATEHIRLWLCWVVPQSVFIQKQSVALFSRPLVYYHLAGLLL